MSVISREAAIKAMEDLISARRVWWGFDSARNEIKGLDAAICEIQNLPSAEKVGKWIYHESDNTFECSACGGKMKSNVFDYCPWCGATMVEGAEE